MEEKEIITEESHPLPPKITKENLEADASTRKGQISIWLRAIAYTLLSSLLISIAAHSLIAPNRFTIGGVSGIAVLINYKTDVPQSLLVLSINLPLIVLAFFLVKRRFAILSAMNIGLQSIWLLILEQLFDNFRIEFNANGSGSDAEKIFAAIAAGILVGVAVALAFKVGGSTGGADIVAVMIQKRVGATSIAWLLFILNVLVIGASFVVYYEKDLSLAYNLLPIMLSAFEAYMESKTNESVTNGFQSAREFRIITDKPDEMARALMKELSRGVTALPATGMYTKAQHTMLLCVVNRRQVVTLKRIMKQVDPDSFAVMANVSQVLGLGFYTDEI